MQTICLKCLSKSPAGRYASASDLADDLDRWMKGEPILARPVSMTGRLRRWCGRNPRVAALLGLVIGLLAGGSILFASLWVKADAAKRKESLASHMKDAAIAEKDGALAEKDAAIDTLERQRYIAQIGEAWSNLESGMIENVRPILNATRPAFRNWEWNYLQRVSESRTMQRPASGFWATAFHPDGQRVAFAESTIGPDNHGHYLEPRATRFRSTIPSIRPDSRLHFVDWDDATKNRNWALQTKSVSHVSFAAGGRRIIVLGDKPALSVWEIESGKLVHEIPGYLTGVLMCPPCETRDLPAYLANVPPNGTSVRFWDAKSGTPLPPFAAKDGETIVRFTPAPDNVTFYITVKLAGNGQRSTYRGRIGSTDAPQLLPPHLELLTFDSSGTRAVARDGDDRLAVIDMTTERVLHRLRANDSIEPEVTLSDSGRRVSARLSDNSIAVWTLPERSIPDAIHKPTRQFTPDRGAEGLRFTGPDRLAVLSSFGQFISRYDEPSQALREWRADESEASKMAVVMTLPALWTQPNGSHLFNSHRERFELRNGTGQQTIRDVKSGMFMNGSIPSPDGTKFLLVRFSMDRTRGPRPIPREEVEMWQTEPPRKLWSIVREDRLAFDARFRPDGREIIVANHRGIVTRLDSENGAILSEQNFAGWENANVAISPFGNDVYWFLPDLTTNVITLTITDPVDGRILRTVSFPEQNDRVGRIRFLDERRVLLAMWKTESLHVWDLKEGRVLTSLPGATGIRHLELSPDGKRVYGLSSKFLSVWDLETGQKLISLPTQFGGTAPIGLALRAGGREIVTLDDRGTIRIWSAGLPPVK